KHFYDALDGELPGLMPGAKEFLERLEASGIPKAIATSSRLHYVEKVFVPLGLMAHFDFVLTADDVTHGKPDPEIYRKAAERFEMPPAEVLVIEDSIAGLRSAIAAGLPCVVVPHESTPRDQLTGARAVVRSLGDPRLFEILGLVS